MNGFTAWFNENKRSESLLDAYNNYKQDMSDTGVRPSTFKQWAKEFHAENEGSSGSLLP
jgi:hypothetical protein